LLEGLVKVEVQREEAKVRKLKEAKVQKRKKTALKLKNKFLKKKNYMKVITNVKKSLHIAMVQQTSMFMEFQLEMRQPKLWKKNLEQ
jgi:hypothetical protein